MFTQLMRHASFDGFDIRRFIKLSIVIQRVFLQQDHDLNHTSCIRFSRHSTPQLSKELYINLK